MTFLPAQRIANIGYSTTTSCDHLTNTFNMRGKRKGVVIPSKIIHGHYGVFQYQHIFLFPKQQLFVNSIFPTITQLVQLYEVFSKLCSIILTYFCAFIVHSTGDHFNGFPIVFQVIFKFLFQFRFHVNRSQFLLCMCLFVGMPAWGACVCPSDWWAATHDLDRTAYHHITVVLCIWLRVKTVGLCCLTVLRFALLCW